MDRSDSVSAEVVSAVLERELDLVEGAIAMVARGATPRVVVAGLQLGEELLQPARVMALRAGVRVLPLRAPNDTGSDIAVERIRD